MLCGILRWTCVNKDIPAFGTVHEAAVRVVRGHWLLGVYSILSSKDDRPNCLLESLKVCTDHHSKICHSVQVPWWYITSETGMHALVLAWAAGERWVSILIHLHLHAAQSCRILIEMDFSLHWSAQVTGDDILLRVCAHAMNALWCDDGLFHPI